MPPPLGKLVDVGGYRVHLYCTGNGSPTVVITGAGYSFDWGLVQPEVAKFTRVCTYDHSGVAWSDPGPTDTCSLRVNELHTAMHNAGITGPYVLVGHSLGALVSRLFASDYPNEVAGMVIVDHVSRSMKVLSRPGLPVGEKNASNVGQQPGPLPDVAGQDQDLHFRKLSARNYQLHLWGDSLPGHAQVMRHNAAMTTECFSEVALASQNRARPLDDKPLIILSASFVQPDASTLGALSSNSKQELVENSSHYIMLDRPNAVIQAIDDVVDAARNHTRLKQ
jgi:pimeloyl-ACP methyl ester carboxylesterase